MLMILKRREGLEIISCLFVNHRRGDEASLDRSVGRRMKAAVVLLAVITLFSSPVVAQDSFIEKQVQSARSQGLTEALINSVPPDYALGATLEQVLATEVPLIVAIEDHVVTVSPQGDQLWTRYKARVIENLAHTSLPRPVGPQNELPVPFANLPRDRILIRNVGGVTKVEGVTIRQSEYPAPPGSGKTYLVFVEFNDYKKLGLTRTAKIPLGAEGLFEYDPELDHISPISKRFVDAFLAEVLSYSSGSVDGLRTAVNARVPRK
jgi:hypothetical protein